MKKIRLVYFATGDIAIPLLRALAHDERFAVEAVVTGADRPAGRKMELKPSPVKEAAEALGIPVFQPEKIRNREALEHVRTLQPDLIVLMAYGQILPLELLQIPSHGSVNVHVSLLPRHRGASPVPSAILAGDPKTGISVMKMVAAMDAGPVYEQFGVPLESKDDAITVSGKLAELAAGKTPEVLVQIAAGKKSPQPQDEARATFCQKISKADGQINWNESADLIARRIRAYAGWPATFTHFQDKNLKILEGVAVPDKSELGHVYKKGAEVLVGAGTGSLQLFRVQLEGKKPMPIQEFIKGQPDFIQMQLH